MNVHSIGISAASACKYYCPVKKEQKKRKKNDNVHVWAGQRKKAFLETSKTIDRCFDGAQRQLYTDLVTDLVNFVNKNLESAVTGDGNNLLCSFIPTALVSLGINPADNSYIFAGVEEELRRNSCSVVEINSKEAVSLTKMTAAITDVVFDDQMLESVKMKRNQLNNFFTFGMILKLYKEVKEEELQLVLIFKDIESLKVNALKDLILVMKEQLSLFKVVFIVGISNTPSTLQYFLPATATDCLQIQTFNCILPTQLCDELITNLMIKSLAPMKLGPDVIALISDVFMFYGFSFQNFRRLLRYSAFEHFYSNPVNILCHLQDFKKSSKILDSKMLKLIKNLPSYNESKEKCDSKQIIELIEKLHSYHNNFTSNLNCLYYLINELHSNPFGTNFYELYTLALDKKSLTKTPEFKKTLHILGLLSKDEWADLFKRVLEKIGSSDLFLTKFLHQYFRKLNDLKADDEQKPNYLPRNGINQEEVKLDFSKCSTRTQWKEKIKSNINSAPKCLSPFDKWKSEVIKNIENLIETELKSPLAFPFSEIIYFNEVSSLKNALPSQRLNLKKILNNQNNTDELNPDVFFILKQFSQLKVATTSLRQWYDVFKEENSKVNEKHLFSCFLNAVADVEFIGLIQLAKRKNDHLMKVVWF